MKLSIFVIAAISSVQGNVATPKECCTSILDLMGESVPIPFFIKPAVMSACDAVLVSGELGCSAICMGALAPFGLDGQCIQACDRSAFCGNAGERKDTVADGFGVEEGSDDSEEESDGKESLDNASNQSSAGWFSYISELATMENIVSQAITIPFIKKPFQDLSHPNQSYGIRNSMNVRIKVGSKVKNEEIGGWFIQPFQNGSEILPKNGDEQFQENIMVGDYLIKENETAILYLHGNAETRAHYHRKALYEIFQTMGYHVLAIDYRGYGDSSILIPNQTSMVEDAKTAFDWLQKYSHPSASIFIWGHSLGTGVASKLTHELTHSKDTDLKTTRLSGLILEAPFNKMSDEVRTFGISRILPWIGLDINETLNQADMAFDSNFWLRSVPIPILMMHAEDDDVIPFHLASKLYDDLKNAGVNVHFHKFSSQEHLGHEGIFKAKSPRPLSDIVNGFVTKALQ